MALTVEILRAAYSYLMETEPFVGWNLPDADDIEFRVTCSKDAHGVCFPPGTYRRKYKIGVSKRSHAHTLSLMITMAHEMVHVHIHQNKIEPWRDHGPAFRALAEEVSNLHGFDPGQF